jgi:AraC-like DNA-binding protein
VDDVLQNSAAAYEPRGRLDPQAFQAHVRFQTFAPPDDLAPFVEHFWSIRWENQTEPYRSEEVMHRPYVDLFVSASWSGVQGTFRGKRDYWAEGSGRIVGARFLPGAFHLFWPEPMSELEDRVLALDEVFRDATEENIGRWLAGDDHAVIAVMAEQLRSVGVRPDKNVALIGEIIDAVENRGLSTVAAVAKEFLQSERWLQQLFRDYVGMGVKWLIQRQRLLAAARTIRGHRPSWAELAYDTGYSSQQHFIADFKRVLGKTPVEYERGLERPATPPSRA